MPVNERLEIYLKLQESREHEDRAKLFEMRQDVLNEICNKYQKKRSDIVAITSFINSLIDFYIRTGFLTEKQIKALEKWKPLYKFGGNSWNMNDLDMGFWSANDFGSQ
jgi:hypothetical protein